jgi:hypothetical protein
MSSTVSKEVKTVAVVSQVLLTSSIALLTHATKVQGSYSYSTLTVQMFSEVNDSRANSWTLFRRPPALGTDPGTTHPVQSKA